MPGSAEGLAAVAQSLFSRVELGANQLFRLVGVGLSNFQSSEEPPLFSSGDETFDGEEACTSADVLKASV
jgi:DNA polymerase IV